MHLDAIISMLALGYVQIMMLVLGNVQIPFFKAVTGENKPNMDTASMCLCYFLLFRGP